MIPHPVVPVIRAERDGRPAPATATQAEVEAAAELLIAAAAAALLWGGSDRCGVLAHVAGASAARIAAERTLYTLLAQSRSDAPTPAPPGFDPAALPAAAAPGWSARVAAAMGDASEDQVAGYRGGGGGGGLHPDPAVQVRAVHGFVRSLALLMCRLWGEDPMPLHLVEAAARRVDLSARPAWSSEPGNHSSNP